MVDVTDIFDSFHRVAAVLWREFGASLADVAEDEEAPGFDELLDQLELDLFLPACARRARERTGEYVDPDYVAQRLRLTDERGEQLSGAAGQYHSHAFHPESPTGDVPCAILTADLMTVPRTGIRLQLAPGRPELRIRRGGRDLPVH